MIKPLVLFTSVSIIALSGSSALGATFTLTGSELKLRTEGQSTSTSQLFVTSFPVSATVSESTVEFPNVESLFDPSVGVPPGFANSLVDVSIDAGSDYLTIDFDNIQAGFRGFASGFKNTYVFTFTAPVALQITSVLIDPMTTLGLTPERVTFAGNELSVNVQGLSFNPNTFARINLSGITVPTPTPTPTPETKTVPEPGTLSAVLLSGLMMLRYGKRGQKD